MKKVVKTYVEFVFPGSFMNEYSRKEVEEIGGEVTVPEGAFAYRFYQQDYVEDGDQTFTGDVHDRTGLTYVDGEVYDEERLKAEFGEDSTLFHNVIGNGYTHAVKTRRGNFQQLVDGDTVTKDGEVIFPA